MKLLDVNVLEKQMLEIPAAHREKEKNYCAEVNL